MATAKATAKSPSTRSSTPPWPGMRWPLSLTPKWRLKPDSTKSPACSTMPSRALASTSGQTEGAPSQSAATAPTTMPAAMPPRSPAQVLFGLMRGASFGPADRPPGRIGPGIDRNRQGQHPDHRRKPARRLGPQPDDGDAGQTDIERPETLPGAASAGTAHAQKAGQGRAQDEEQQREPIGLAGRRTHGHGHGQHRERARRRDAEDRAAARRLAEGAHPGPFPGHHDGDRADQNVPIGRPQPDGRRRQRQQDRRREKALAQGGSLSARRHSGDRAHETPRWRSPGRPA